MPGTTSGFEPSDGFALTKALVAAQTATAWFRDRSCQIHAVGAVRRQEMIVFWLGLLASVPASDRAVFAARLMTAFGRDRRGRVARRGMLLGVPVRIHACEPRQLGAALLCLTGNEPYLARCQDAARAHGLRLNRRGLWTARGELACDCADERKVLERLELQWTEPEQRTWNT